MNPPSMHPMAVYSRGRRARLFGDLPTWPRKEEACCAATRDEYGRLCIGYCSPACERRL